MKVSCSVATFLFNNARPHQGWQHLNSYRKEIHDNLNKYYPETEYKIKHELFIYIWKKKQGAVYSTRLATVEVERYVPGKIFNINFDKVSFGYNSGEDSIVCYNLIQKI